MKRQSMSHNPNTRPGSDSIEEGRGGVLDEMRGCGKWGWLMLLSVPLLPTSICLLLLRLLFRYHTQTHINTLSLRVSLSLSVILSGNTKPLSPALVLLTQSFQTQWGEGSGNRDLLWSVFVLILQNVAQYLSGNSAYLICYRRCAVTRALSQQMEAG